MEKNKDKITSSKNSTLSSELKGAPVSAISQVIKNLKLSQAKFNKTSTTPSLQDISLKSTQKSIIKQRAKNLSVKDSLDESTHLDSPVKKRLSMKSSLASTAKTETSKKLKGIPKVVYSFRTSLSRNNESESKIRSNKIDKIEETRKKKSISEFQRQNIDNLNSESLTKEKKKNNQDIVYLKGKKVIKKRLTQDNLNEVLHEYRLETDKKYKRQLKNIRELRPNLVKNRLNLSKRESLGNLGVHPHNYDSLIGYRKGIPVINNQKTLEGVRRVLNYLTKIINTPSKTENKMELLIILDNLPNLDTAEGQNNYLSLLTLTIARIRPLKNLVILPKTMKEAIRYLTSRATIPMISTSSKTLPGTPKFTNSDSVYGDNTQENKRRNKLSLTKIGTNPENLCGVLMINPAKSKLSELAHLVFAKNNKGKGKQSSDSSLGAIGSLCAKKGIPLISLCDVSSPLTYSTYPIICNTRNLEEVYLVLDLLSYGLNQTSTNQSPDWES